MKRLAATGILVMALAGCSSTEGLSGGDLFRSVCAGCHGADGAGNIGPAIGPGSRAALELDDARIGEVIRTGPGAMPAFDTRLSSEQIDGLIEYLRELQAG